MIDLFCVYLTNKVQLSEHQEREGQLTQFVEVAVHDELREPLHQTPKAKSFDLY